ncbi:26S proteasome non-ATPase regulatory subunit 8 [Eurytemora carolleeae]|uniref:26S proteasome non-ATPase regulatory subunit 8 n=1 Tax=Eurytemora carolleeae TaxID=1294199 RepID=UPI000C78CBE5|nr:26S proteasome non-ATPase regulatory subunit 8 [Eurytemora carolleeae]|eukprot:XP_023319554.1 26S proteasome non-ATPase regulatory subunit 8-like [Eurytemora affinis]
MADLKTVVSQYQELSKEWSKAQNKDLTKIGKLLEQLKLSLTQLSFLPTKGEEASVQELTVSRDTLEIGAQYCVSKQDTQGFERYMAQLQTYYYDFAEKLPESAFKYQLLGLNLLCLLAQNRVAEFHTELERLPHSETKQNIYIRHPVSLEQYIMEGSYNKVLLAKGNVPAESFNYFIDILLNTVRNEIASCMEKAYNDMSCSDAARMLSIEQGELESYGAERGWIVSKGRLAWKKEGGGEEGGVPSLELANMAISYAREMEQIV